MYSTTFVGAGLLPVDVATAVTKWKQRIYALPDSGSSSISLRLRYTLVIVGPFVEIPLIFETIGKLSKCLPGTKHIVDTTIAVDYIDHVHEGASDPAAKT